MMMACAVTGTGFDADVAVVRFNDASDNGKSKAGAFGFGGAQNGGKCPLLQILAHALAGILEFHRDMCRFSGSCAAAERRGI